MVGKVDSWTRANQAAIGEPGLAGDALEKKIATSQTQLQAGGYYGGKIDSEWGSGSNTGMKRFLRDFPLPQGAEDTPSAKIAWLNHIASTGFRTPSTFELMTASTRDANGNKTPLPDQPTRVRSRAATKTGSTEKSAADDDAKYIRDLGPETLAHDLFYTTGRSFEAAYDHTSPQSHTLSRELVAHHVAMADELSRRAPALPLWTPVLNPEIDQAKAGAQLTSSYFLAARWYETQSQDAKNPKAAADKAESIRLYQAALDAARAYGRAPSNLPGATETNAYAGQYRGVLEQIPASVFYALQVDGKSLATATSTPADAQKDDGPKSAAARKAAMDSVLSGTAEARRLPTKAQIAAAFFPVHRGSDERQKLQKAIVDAQYEVQQLERAIAGGQLRKAVAAGEMKVKNKAPTGKFAASVSAKGDLKLSAPDYNPDDAKQEAFASDKLTADTADVALSTRGYLLDRIRVLRNAEARLATGEAMTKTETDAIKAVRIELEGQVRGLQKTPPAYARIVDLWAKTGGLAEKADAAATVASPARR